MSDILQDDLARHPPWLVRGAAIGTAILAIAAVGWFAPTRDAPVRVLSQDGEHDYLRTVERMIAGAKRRIWVMLYVVRTEPGGPVDGLLMALAQAKSRGVAVHVILDQPRTDADPDEQSRNRAAAALLRDHGITALWDEPGRTTHAKVLLIDDTVVIGSHNWTRYALLLNREISVVTDEPSTVQAAEREFRLVPGFAPDRY